VPVRCVGARSGALPRRWHGIASELSYGDPRIELTELESDAYPPGLRDIFNPIASPSRGLALGARIRGF
jgi:hypothetical protein